MAVLGEKVKPICLVQHTEKFEYFPSKRFELECSSSRTEEEYSSSKRLEENTQTSQCAVLGKWA